MNTAGVNKTLMTNMFRADFKFHLKAIDSLAEVGCWLAFAIGVPFDLHIRFVLFRILVSTWTLRGPIWIWSSSG